MLGVVLSAIIPVNQRLGDIPRGELLLVVATTVLAPPDLGCFCSRCSGVG